MRKLVISVLFVLLSLSISMLAWATDENQSAEEKQEEKIRGEIAAGILSAYIWRGQRVAPWCCAPASIMVSYRDFAASLWGNLDTDPYTVGGQRNSSNFTETDVTISYSRKFGILQAGIGYIYYGLPGQPARCRSARFQNYLSVWDWIPSWPLR